jgi:alpha/beta superfamily hydrolase
MREEALLFGPRDSLVGVITWPSETTFRPPLPAVLLLNAGILHRVGANRTYVTIARSLAALGLVVLRFDFSGIGDSLPRDDNLPFEQASLQEVQQAMATLQMRAGSTQFVLMGLCSGAYVSLQVALTDSRVIGAVLINADRHLHDSDNEELGAALRSRALVQHYRRIVLASSFRAKNWLKALSGDMNLPLLRQAVRGFRLHNPLRRQRAEPAPREYALVRLHALSARGVRLLHIYSEGDEGLDYFRLVLGKEADAQPMELIRGANHTFTLLWSQERLVQVICAWAKGFLA